MKFKRCEALTQTKIRNWFKESYFIDAYKIAHMYRYDKFTYRVLIVDKKFGTPFELYINTTTQCATTQHLSGVMVHNMHDVSDMFFKEV